MVLVRCFPKNDLFLVIKIRQGTYPNNVYYAINALQYFFMHAKYIFLILSFKSQYCVQNIEIKKIEKFKTAWCVRDSLQISSRFCILHLPWTRFYLSAYADKHLGNTFSIFINPKPLTIMLGAIRRVLYLHISWFIFERKSHS